MVDNELIYAAVLRVEEKLNLLLAALSEDEPEDWPSLTLDGEAAGEERDQTQAL